MHRRPCDASLKSRSFMHNVIFCMHDLFLYRFIIPYFKNKYNPTAGKLKIPPCDGILSSIYHADGTVAGASGAVPVAKSFMRPTRSSMDVFAFTKYSIAPSS